MDQAQLLSLIGSLYDKFVKDVSERVIDQLNTSGLLTTEVDRRIKDMIDVNRELVTTWTKDELKDVLGDFDDRIEEYMSNNFDINDYADNLDIEDKITDYMENNLRDEVRDQVRNMDFTVTVE